MNHDELQVIHMPLKRLAVCLDCEESFVISNACPACGSRTFVLLARFLEGAGAV